MPILCDNCKKQPSLKGNVNKQHWLSYLHKQNPTKDSFMFVPTNKSVLVMCYPCFKEFYEENFSDEEKLSPLKSR